MRSSVGHDRGDEGVRRHRFRHADRRRRHRDPAVDTRSARFSAQGVRKLAGASPRSAPARSSWPKPVCSTAGAPRPIGALRRELQERFPKVKVEEDRIFIIDGPVWTSAGHERRHRPRAGHGREGFRRGTGAVGREEARGLPPPRRRPVAVFGAAGVGTQIRSHPERAGLREAKPRIRRFRSSNSPRPRISARGSSAARSAPKPASRRPKRSRTFASKPHG